MTVLRYAPPRFLIVGTSYGGGNLALEVVVREASRVGALWLMGCNPGPASDPITARERNERVQRGEFDAVVDELAATIVYEHGPHVTDAANSFRRMARRAGSTVSYDRMPPSWADVIDGPTWRKSPVRRSWFGVAKIALQAWSTALKRQPRSPEAS